MPTLRDEDFRIRRILFAVDVLTDTLNSLDATAEIAGRLGAQLVVLLVEDLDLLRSAALSFVREIRLKSGVPQRLDSKTLEQQLRTRATHVRRRLEEIARKWHLTFSFRVTRGEMSHEIATASEDMDLIVLEGITRSAIGKTGLSSKTRTAARQSIRTVLVLHQGQLNARRFMIVYEGTELSDKALVIAVRLSKATDAAIHVLVLAGETKRAEAFQTRIRKTTKRLGIHTMVEFLGEPTLVDICQLARRMPDTVLVVAADGSLLEGAKADQLMDQITCPLVVAH